MIIDCHGHFTTEPPSVHDFRAAQVAAFKSGAKPPLLPTFTDAEIGERIEANQLRLMRERGLDMVLFSPRAAGMGHHVGDETVSLRWSTLSNDLVKRVADLFPERFVPVCQLPQSTDSSPQSCVAELRRCVLELGFVGCNLNPDPSGGWWRTAPLTDRSWYPLYEAMVDLDVPAMVHVSGSCNPVFHHTGSHYINADTTAFMQLLCGDLFSDFPTLRFVIPHGGGAVPYHWGRYRGLADMLKKPPLAQHLMNNVYFDTCVYHQPGIDLLANVIDARNVLFGSEMVGAVRGIDPQTSHAFDDTRRYVEALPISKEDKNLIFSGNVRRVYPRLDALLRARGL